MLTAFSHRHSGSGFTLIELAVVLIVIGLILGLGLGSWRMLVESREIARTQSILRQAKSCLMQRMYHSLQYPTYDEDLQVADCVNNSFTDDVGSCLCQPGMKDARGNSIRYLDGLDGNGDELEGKNITRQPYHLGSGSVQAVKPGSDSSVSLEDGKKVKGVAFVLLSAGRDEKFEIIDKDSCFPDSRLVSNLDDCSIDMEEREDDQYLIVPGREIRAQLQD